MRWFLFLSLFVLGPSFAQAMNLKVCNGGRDDIYLSSAIYHTSAFGGYYSIGGWSFLENGECWTNPHESAQQIELLPVYVDSLGNPGAAGFNVEFLMAEQGPLSYRRGDKKFCINLNDRFHRERVTQSDTYCEEGMVMAPYTLQLVGSHANGTLNLFVDSSVPNDPENLFTAPRRPLDRGEDEPINLVRGPSSEQIAGAEARDLQHRLGIAGQVYGIKATKIDVGEIDLERCVTTRDELAYCRYKIDTRMSDNELGPIARMLNMGFILAGYQWSSFVVRDGRWEIDLKYDRCTVTDTNIRCSRRE